MKACFPLFSPSSLFSLFFVQMILLYPITRLFMKNYTPPDSTLWTGLNKEIELYLLAGAVVLIRGRRSVSVEELAQKIFNYFKVVNLVLYWDINAVYTFWYGLVLLIGMLALSQPSLLSSSASSSSLLTSPFVSVLDLSSFQLLVIDNVKLEDLGQEEEEGEGEEESKSKQAENDSIMNDNDVWLVMFHAPWCERSHFVSPLFLDLAERFGIPNRQDVDMRDEEGTARFANFAVLDISLFPATAAEYNIDDSGFSKQIPTMMLFYKGKEISRLPTFDSEGKVVPCPFDEEGVVRYFELNKRSLEKTVFFQQASSKKKDAKGKKDKRAKGESESKKLMREKTGGLRKRK